MLISLVSVLCIFIEKVLVVNNCVGYKKISCDAQEYSFYIDLR